MDPKHRVLNFFKNELNNYVVGDLNRLSEIHPDRRTGFRGCTIPQAMLIFALLDLLGYLINDDPTASKRNTLNNYKFIFSSTCGLFPKEYEKESDRIVKLFRHGIIHQFFPKASGIAKLSKDMPLLGLNGNIPCLNVNRLTHDTLNAIRKLHVQIENSKCDELVNRINNRLDILAKEDFEELSNLIQICT